jgi:hypothetical protein
MEVAGVDSQAPERVEQLANGEARVACAYHVHADL